MKIRDIKLEIKQCIETEQYDQALLKIQEHKTLLKIDIETYTLEACCYYCLGDIEKGIQVLEEGLRKNKFNYDINYNLGLLYEQTESVIESMRYYIAASILANQKEEKDLANKAIDILLDRIVTHFINQPDKIREVNKKIQEIKDEIYLQLEGNARNFPQKSELESYVGKFYNEKFYVGKYDYYFAERIGQEIFKSYQTYKVELYKAELKSYFEISTEGDYLVPIAFNELNQIIQIETPMACYQIKGEQKNRYYYYTIKGPAKLSSSTPFICGEPIKKYKKKNNKALVLNLFIDGLSQTVIEDIGLENLMPNTYRFFNKGTICDNVYVSGEWTYVNMASFFTGKYIPQHKMFHPIYINQLPKEHKILSEVFNENQYFTTKLDGEWRSVPPYGYDRGMDRILYQPAILGMLLEDIIMELIEHIETFKGTNQFIWTCINDLHDVADALESRMWVQSQMDIKHRQIKKKDINTSVRVKYNEDKIERYKLQIKRVDTYLGMLFSYIENNFEDKDIVVSLVSDHGQSYLIKEDEEFLCDKRTKVPMMFRGDVKQGICSEFIQGLDLMPILCKLCDIPLDMNGLDCNLPIYFGGEESRNYVYSESIFPESTYKAAVHMPDQTFFYETKEKVQNDGRVKMDEFNTKLINHSDSKLCTDKKLINELIEKVNKHMKFNRIY